MTTAAARQARRGKAFHPERSPPRASLPKAMPNPGLWGQAHIDVPLQLAHAQAVEHQRDGEPQQNTPLVLSRKRRTAFQTEGDQHAAAATRTALSEQVGNIPRTAPVPSCTEVARFTTSMESIFSEKMLTRSRW